MWVPVAAVAINAGMCFPDYVYLHRSHFSSHTVLGFTSNFMSLTVYHSPKLYSLKYHGLSLQLGVAWGWVMFVVHTLLTFAILGRMW